MAIVCIVQRPFGFGQLSIPLRFMFISILQRRPGWDCLCCNRCIHRYQDCLCSNRQLSTRLLSRLEAIARIASIASRRKDATRAPGLTTRSKKLLGAKGIATRSKDATRLEANASGGWFSPGLARLQEIHLSHVFLLLGANIVPSSKARSP